MERIPVQFVTYADVVLAAVPTGYVAGVTFRKKSSKPYRLGSVYLKGIESKNQALIAVVTEIAREVEKGTQLLIVRGPQAIFEKKASIESKINIVADMNVKVYRNRIHERVAYELNALANDAGERKETVFVDL